MTALLTKYTVSEILIFIIALAVAVREFFNYFDWAKKRFKEPSETQKRIAEIEQLSEFSREILEKVSVRQDKLEDTLESLTGKIDILMDSDKDDIKAYLTEKHHLHCYELKWIDDYSLDCILKRYEHYKAEKGNSFAAELVEEIKALPKIPPEQQN